MEFEITEGFESAILLLTKGDEVHIRTTANVTPEEFFELIVGISVILQEMFDSADAKAMNVITRAMH